MFAGIVSVRLLLVCAGVDDLDLDLKASVACVYPSIHVVVSSMQCDIASCLLLK